MTKSPRRKIEEIREEYMGLKDKPRKSLKNAIAELAEGLNSKETHFVFELIQNAEDNTYARGVSPMFSIETAHMIMDGKPVPVVIIRNNETGFAPDHVEALCQVGQSTKKKAEGYIGEKGIGFKSVFKVTDCPHIISNGYQFCLPKDDAESGLGYIVPTWVNDIPARVNPQETTIILPLLQDKVSDVANAITEIAPETILFLKKLQSIRIKSTLSNTRHVDCKIEKSHEKRSNTVSIVTLRVSGEVDGEEQDQQYRYWLYCKSYEKPSDIHHEKRKTITTRDVSIAIPLDADTPANQLFAYLPVWENTGLPFLINADFLLVSSREGIQENEKWNLWLRDCVADAYCNAFVDLIHDPELSIEEKSLAYASIPMQAHEKFLHPVVAQIHEELADRKCILVQPDDHIVAPEHARIPLGEFQYVIDHAKDLPRYLCADIQLVSKSIQCYKDRLECIGVQELATADKFHCFQDDEWLTKQSLNWLMRLYQYLEIYGNEFHDFDLTKLNIVPIETTDSRYRLSCAQEQPIYFPPDADEQKILQQIPKKIRNKVPLEFVNKNFLEIIDGNVYGRKDFMTSSLDVYPINLDNLIIDIINYLNENQDERLILLATSFIVENVTNKTILDQMPIVLDDGKIIILGNAKRPCFGQLVGQIVVPENFSPKDGWQHIWPDEDRTHFNILSKKYDRQTVGAMLKSELISMFPLPQYFVYYVEPQTIKNFRQDYFGPDTSLSLKSLGPSLIKFLKHMYDIHIVEHASTNILQFNWNDAYPDMRRLKIEWAFQREYYTKDGQAYKNSGRYKFTCRLSSFAKKLIETSWLPTTKGLVRPSTAFLPKKEIIEVLGNNVPYFKGKLPNEIIILLGIKEEVTTETLLEYLISIKNNNEIIDIKIISTIYRELAHRRTPSCYRSFLDNDLICITNDNGNNEWHSPDECIWEDAHNALGGAYVYLERHYPKLKDFFVDLLKVKERPDPDTYAERWRQYQDAPDADPKKRQSVMESLYKGLRACIVSDNDDWASAFLKDVKIYTQNDIFCPPGDVVLPDDERLRKLFQGGGIEYAWRPSKEAFRECRDFYEKLGVRVLSESVREELKDCGALVESRKPNRYVTHDAVYMIAAWLREKHRDDHNKFLESKGFERLFLLRECETESDIHVRYTLKTEFSTEEKVESVEAYWQVNEKDNRLLYTTKVIPADLAICLAKMIIRKSHYKDLADFIELCLEASNTKRVKQKGWSVPQEILDLKKQIDTGEMIDGTEEPAETTVIGKDDDTHGQVDAEPAPSPLTPSMTPKPQDPLEKPTSPDENSQTEKRPPTGPPRSKRPVMNPANETSEDDAIKMDDENEVEVPDSPEDTIEGDSFDFGVMFQKSFNRDGEMGWNEDMDDVGYYHGNGPSVKDPVRRGHKERNRHSEAIRTEPGADERRRRTVATLLEPPDPQTRHTLFEWYHGRCQMCGKTFPDSHGEPFFIAAYLVERRHKRYVDNVGNALCLCADHFAKWRHATKNATDIRQQVLNIDLSDASDAPKPALHFTMLGKEHRIEYDQRHFIALRALLEITANMHE